MKTIQLFTKTGELYATVNAPMLDGSIWPDIVMYDNIPFMLADGRYVKAEAVVAQAVTADR